MARMERQGMERGGAKAYRTCGHSSFPVTLSAWTTNGLNTSVSNRKAPERCPGFVPARSWLPAMACGVRCVWNHHVVR
jgi:hypothetical protein